MAYEVILISADIRSLLDGDMRLGLEHNGVLAAEIEYHWNEEHFTATFRGHAPSMPIGGHPTMFIERPIAAVNKLKTEKHRFSSDVFTDNRVFMTTEPKE